jgi:hypothetical protein
MLDLFARGVELQAAGHHSVDDDSEEHLEFVALRKKLEWKLINLPLHCASVFDAALDGLPPDYLTPSHAMYIDRPLAQSWRRALMVALDARRVV